MAIKTTMNEQLATRIYPIMTDIERRCYGQIKLQVAEELLVQTFKIENAVYHRTWELVGRRIFWHCDDRFENQSGIYND